MNKLMFVAAGVAVAGSAFSAPLVYDYKASVKHMYLKEVKVKTSTFSGTVYQKYQKSSSLKGYLVMDEDGVTSATYGGTCDNTGVYSADWGKNRGFLVVLNSSAESKVKMPKILPAVLDAKWIDTNWKKDHEATSGLAEGTLFVGGDTIAPLRPKLEYPDDVITENATAVSTAVAAATPGLVAYADYVWTSLYLFGQFNGPNWFVRTAGDCPFETFETKWNDQIPTGVKREYFDSEGNLIDWADRPVINYFHDTWMNGAGIGKYTVPSETTGELCCGLTEVTTSEIILESLSGNLKGGLFLCTENGIDAITKGYVWFDGEAWEDQFACKRDDAGAITDYSTDSWLNDLWQDGAVEQETTDVLYGTWSIKYNKTFLTKIAKELTDTEKGLIIPDVSRQTVKRLALWASIKGAADKLYSKTYIFWNGNEIYDAAAGSRFTIPMVTPKFATYYGLR